MSRAASRPIDHVDRGELRRCLVEWSELLLEDAGGNGLLHSLVLRHQGSRIPVATYRHVKGETDLDALVDRIARATERDAECYKGETQIYALEGVWGAESTGRQRYAIPVALEDTNADVIGPSRTPNAAGVVGEAIKLADVAMRNGEKRSDVAIGAALRVAELQVAQTDRYITRIEKLEKEKDDLQKKLDEANDRKFERDIKAKESEERAKNIRELISMCKALLPVAFNRLAGEKILPEPVSPIFELFAQLYDAIDDKTLGKVAGALSENPKAAMILGELMTKVQDLRDTNAAKAVVTAQMASGQPAPKKLDRPLDEAAE